MPPGHLVRVGLMGAIGRFESPSAHIFPRGTRVICRTTRGQEVGIVLTPPPSSFDGEVVSPKPADGFVLRRVTPEDDLLLARLDRYRQRAFRACQRLLRRRAVGCTLVEVEQLFDGATLYFYFLGPVSAEVESIIAELAELYAAKIEIRRFAEAVEQGCGPGCGTDQAPGCGPSCSSCSLVGACGTSGRLPAVERSLTDDPPSELPRSETH